MIDGCKPIQKLNSINNPRYLAFFDTESYTDENTIGIEFELLPDGTTAPKYNNDYHSLRLGVVIYVELNKDYTERFREVYHFRTACEFWNYIDSKTRKNITLHIYAHNAKYDCLNVHIVNELKRLHYDVPYPTLSNAFILTAKKNKRTIKIVDTFNYSRTSLESMGEKLGLPKINLGVKGEINFNKIPDKELLTYCENDVKITEKFMVSLFKWSYDNNLGTVEKTTASTAMSIYRHSFITNTIYYHKNDRVLNLERAAYRGGIVECFYIGELPKGDYYLLDINSMYVSIMSSKKLPLYPEIINDNPTVSDLHNAVLKASENNQYVIADVLLNTDYNSGFYGLKNDNKLIFPKGEFRISLHQAELKRAVQDNIIVKVYQYVIYHEDYCLDKYANYFSDMKIKADNNVDREFAKLLGNGLYGKFGMRKYDSDKMEVKDLMKAGFIDANEPLEPYIPFNDGIYYLWGSQYIRTTTDDYQHVNRTNVALAGAVTTYARLLLATYIELVGYGNIFYSDTDSLAVNKIGYERLQQHLHDKELGKLKLELRFTNGKIKAPKNYTFIQKKKVQVKRFYAPSNNHITSNRLSLEFNNKIQRLDKRISNEYIKKNQLTFNQKSIILKRRYRTKGIPNGAMNENGVYYFWRFTTFKENLRSNGKLKGRILVKRKNTLKFTKGIKQSANGFTKPFKMIYGVKIKWKRNRKKQIQITNLLQMNYMIIRKQKKMSLFKQKIMRMN